MIVRADAQSLMKLLDNTVRNDIGNGVTVYSVEVDMGGGSEPLLVEQSFKAEGMKPKDVVETWQNIVLGSIDEEQDERDSKARRRRNGYEIGDDAGAERADADAAAGTVASEAAVPAPQAAVPADATLEEILVHRRDAAHSRIADLDRLIAAYEVERREILTDIKKIDAALAVTEEG